MKTIIFGLGNPGDEFNNTRHNYGRMCVEDYVSEHNLEWKNFQNCGKYAKFNQGDNEIYLLISTSYYMNNSGELIKKFADYFDVPYENIIILHDDMDFPVGSFKIRAKGSGGGHNGMKNVVLMLGTADIKRIRLGIDRPKYDEKDYVIAKFKPQELTTIKQTINEINNTILPKWFSDGRFDLLMNLYNK